MPLHQSGQRPKTCPLSGGAPKNAIFIIGGLGETSRATEAPTVTSAFLYLMRMKKNWVSTSTNRGTLPRFQCITAFIQSLSFSWNQDKILRNKRLCSAITSLNSAEASSCSRREPRAWQTSLRSMLLEDRQCSFRTQRFLASFLAYCGIMRPIAIQNVLHYNWAHLRKIR